ncbi:hypothetical protein QFZ32_007657 [Streptomyces canus]|nr:hypothetical protein [Streptomyces canus]
MRVVIVTESFPPDVNGVAPCALQTARHLVERGHLPPVVAPTTASGPGHSVDALAPCPVVRGPSLPLPGYPQVRVALPSRRAAAAIAEHLADACRLEGVKVVVVGDGPSRPNLEQALPGAVFLGRRVSDELAKIFASFDVFAHRPLRDLLPDRAGVHGERCARRRARRRRSAGPRRPRAHRIPRPSARPRRRDTVWSLAADPEMRASFGVAAGRAARRAPAGQFIQLLRISRKRTGVPGTAWAAAGRSESRTTPITG